MNKLKVFLSVILFGVMSMAYAAPSSELSSLLNLLQTMQADFTQTVYDNNNKEIQKSFGKMALQRPGKFRWDVTKPIPQLIVANGTRLWIYDRDLEQVTIRALHQAAGDSPAELLSHENTTIDKDYVVKTIQKKNMTNWQWFSLAPRNADSMLAEIQIGFQNKQLQEMYLQDHLGHTTKIQFLHIKSNISLADALFTFKKPAGVDVIDETKRR
jgi:outer membrane lipoprotein carrier protein